MLRVALLVHAPLRATVETRASTEVPPAVVFASGGSRTAEVVSELDAAQRMVDVQAYLFTSRQFAKALVTAEKRGLQVEAILQEQPEHAVFGRGFSRA